MEKEMKSGCYIITNQKKEDEKFLVLVSGNNPFLKIEIIWSLNKNIVVSDDVLRGKNFDWNLHNNFQSNSFEMNLKNGFYLIKGNDKDYSLTEEREDKINSLEISDEHKKFFKNLFKEEPTPKLSDLLVEIVGQNPFLTIKSVKNVDTGEDITKRFVSKDVDDVNCLWTLSKHLEWVIQ